ncbi:hypothetical protein CASFOL_003436 [Castilleja foliolosa]|uniref:Uncharacterized protein n=1 Tax=Castilleja foliolosa TaxID=1961234 RepID=A0ABD3EKW7_9LAMI
MSMSSFSSSSSSSSTDDESAIIQVVMARRYKQMQRRRNQQAGHVGSVHGRAWIPRDRAGAAERIHTDYFSENPLYGEHLFRQRFRMSRRLFLRIFGELQQHDDFFVQRSDAIGAAGLSSIQKMTAALRMLAYGTPADSLDEYVKIGKSTTVASLRAFCRGVVSIFKGEYMRSPTEAEQRGFPGMLGSLDCMHWQWDKCPTAYHGFFTGRSSKPTLILEASNLFDELSAGRAPPANFVVNGTQYDMGYYLANGIYPKWATLVQTISQPQGRKKKLFARMQEAYRKDVERAFGVLQSRFAITHCSF